MILEDFEKFLDTPFSAGGVSNLTNTVNEIFRMTQKSFLNEFFSKKLKKATLEIFKKSTVFDSF